MKSSFLDVGTGKEHVGVTFEFLDAQNAWKRCIEARAEEQCARTYMHVQHHVTSSTFPSLSVQYRFGSCPSFADIFHVSYVSVSSLRT